MYRRNPEAEEAVLERAYQALAGDRRPGIHATDLVFCLRKPFFRRGSRSYPGREVALLHLLGAGHHRILEGLAAEVQVERDGILCTIDAVEEDGSGPIVCEPFPPASPSPGQAPHP